VIEKKTPFNSEGQKRQWIIALKHPALKETARMAGRNYTI